MKAKSSVLCDMKPCRPLTVDFRWLSADYIRHSIPEDRILLQMLHFEVFDDARSYHKLSFVPQLGGPVPRSSSISTAAN
jgi:hypothetical protein